MKKKRLIMYLFWDSGKGTYRKYNFPMSKRFKIKMRREHAKRIGFHKATRKQKVAAGIR